MESVMYGGKRYDLHSCVYGNGQVMAVLVNKDGGFIACPISAITMNIGAVGSPKTEVNKPVHKKRGRPSGVSDGV